MGAWLSIERLKTIIGKKCVESFSDDLLEEILWSVTVNSTFFNPPPPQTSHYEYIIGETDWVPAN